MNRDWRICSCLQTNLSGCPDPINDSSTFMIRSTAKNISAISLYSAICIVRLPTKLDTIKSLKTPANNPTTAPTIAVKAGVSHNSRGFETFISSYRMRPRFSIALTLFPGAPHLDSEMWDRALQAVRNLAPNASCFAQRGCPPLGKVCLDLFVRNCGARIVQGLLHLGAEPGVVFGCVRGQRKRKRALIRRSSQQNPHRIRDGNSQFPQYSRRTLLHCRIDPCLH